jgi:IS30 family transposase
MHTSYFRTKDQASALLKMVYLYILADKHFGGDLYGHLRCKKQRRKHYGNYDRRGTLSNRVGVDK